MKAGENWRNQTLERKIQKVNEKISIMKKALMGKQEFNEYTIEEEYVIFSSIVTVKDTNNFVIYNEKTMKTIDVKVCPLEGIVEKLN